MVGDELLKRAEKCTLQWTTMQIVKYITPKDKTFFLTFFETNVRHALKRIHERCIFDVEL